MHTKGPWRVDKPKMLVGKGKENDRLISGEDGRHIAETFQYQSHDSPNGPSIANAHLIAAAPDMLEMLQAVRIYFKRRHLGESADELLDEVLEVIRKAKGE